ncbi:MAG TPA: hypothetical protein VGD84_19565 [Pseudonocardiaceae bacterium]
MTWTSRRTAAVDGKGTGRGEGMQAVVGEFVGRDVIPEIAGLGAVGQQVSDQIV